MRIFMSKNYRKNKGFTLLELLVVVLIIGVLASIALPQYRKAVGKAELAQVISATKVIQNAEERFYLTNGSYTNNLNQLDINLPNSNVICGASEESYSVCYNKNYLVTHYYRETTSKDAVGCYAKNKILATVCESYFKKTAQPSNSANGWCPYITDGTLCYKVIGAKLPM